KEHEQLQKNREIYSTLQLNSNQINEMAATQNKIAISNIEITAKIVTIQQEIAHLTDTITSEQSHINTIAHTTTLNNNLHYQQLLTNKKQVKDKLNESAYNTDDYAKKQKEL